MANGRDTRGFTLIEVVVSLWILSVALLAGMALVLQQPRVVRRIDAERQAVRGMEWALESIRGGVIPLQSEVLEGFVNAGQPQAPASNLTVSVTVAPGSTAGLYEVTLVGRYSVYGQAKMRQMQTLVWRPGGGPVP
jgi:prepilin-type N-terminal cleavage/methylation domain-containing protein